MTISLLFAALLFSMVIFIKGLYGHNPEIIISLGFVATYFIPFFIFEISAKKILKKQAGKKRIYLSIILLSLLTSFLLVILWIIAVLSFLQLQGDEGMIFIGIPFIYLISFVLSLLLSLVLRYLEKNNGSGLFKKISLAVYSISFILLIAGGGLLARCGGQGCHNIDYLTERAMRENNPAVCNLAGKVDFSSPSFVSSLISLPLILVPSPTHGSNAESCYAELAIKTDNAALCPLGGFLSNDCYGILAINLSDPSICGKITNNYERDDCLKFLAEKTKNDEVCKKIGTLRTIQSTGLSIWEFCEPKIKE